MTKKAHPYLGDLEYLRVALGLGIVREDMIAAPLSHGAGVIRSLVHADGIVKIPAGINGIRARDCFNVHIYRTMGGIKRLLLLIGSYDLTIDLIAQYFARDGIRISSANPGSIGVLIALSRREDHIAGSHLLDPETAERNLSYIPKYMSENHVHIVELVLREQYLIVVSGNPKHIQSPGDFARVNVHSVNRKSGVCTLIFLDHHLKLLGIDPGHIEGHEHDESTHLDVGVLVASERSDFGLGISMAASAHGLAFGHLL